MVQPEDRGNLDARCSGSADRSSPNGVVFRNRRRHAGGGQFLESGVVVEVPDWLSPCVTVSSVKGTAFFTAALLTILSLPVPLESALDWMVSLRRAGPIRIGMSLVEAKRVLGDPAARLEGNVPAVPLDNCAYLNSKRLPKGLGLMFAKGRVVRIDVYPVSSRLLPGQE